MRAILAGRRGHGGYREPEAAYAVAAACCCHDMSGHGKLGLLRFLRPYHLHPRPLRGRVPHVVGQLQVADLAAVLVPARRRPQVHILEITPLNQLSPVLITSLHVSMNIASQQCRPAWPGDAIRTFLASQALFSCAGERIDLRLQCK